MINAITIGEKSYFKVGEKIRSGEKETDIEVLKIKVWFGRVKVYLSDGTVLNYRGFPIIYN